MASNQSDTDLSILKFLTPKRTCCQYQYLRLFIDRKIYLPKEIFIPWNATPIPIGLRIFHRGKAHLNSVDSRFSF
jgi:hypothetical protein